MSKENPISNPLKMNTRQSEEAVYQLHLLIPVGENERYPAWIAFNRSAGIVICSCAFNLEGSPELREKIYKDELVPIFERVSLSKTTTMKPNPLKETQIMLTDIQKVEKEDNELDIIMVSYRNIENCVDVIYEFLKKQYTIDISTLIGEEKKIEEKKQKESFVKRILKLKRKTTDEFIHIEEKDITCGRTEDQ